MYIRIELDDPSDLVGSLKTLRESLPKTVKNYFPNKKMVAGNFFREEPLLDWSSIGTWCELASETSHTDECCHILSSVAPGKLLQAVPQMIELIRKEREVDYHLSFYIKKYKTGFEARLSQVEKQLQIEFDFSRFPSGDAKAIATLQQAWSNAQKQIPALKAVTLNLGKGVTFSVDSAAVKSGKIESSPNHLLLTHSGAGIRSGLNSILKWVEQCEPLFEVTSTFLSIQLVPADAAKVSQQLSEAVGKQLTIHFDGVYRPNFHPDQVLKDFPPEGYWVFPMFAIRGGKENHQTMDFCLVQTPKQRFIEVNVTEDKYLKKIEGKVDYQVYEGPAQKRWNLHKLRKK